jgi:hypothetical protein
VRRQGLEPRTRGLRVDCWGAPHALPAPTSQESARNAHNAQGCDRYSFHEPFHGIPARPGEFPSPSVAERPEASPSVSGENAHLPAVTGDFGARICMVVSAHNRAVCPQAGRFPCASGYGRACRSADPRAGEHSRGRAGAAGRNGSRWLGWRLWGNRRQAPRLVGCMALRRC